MVETVEQKMAELVEAEKQRREARAVALAERREAQRVEARRRRDAQLRRAAERLLAAENAPSRQILGVCWLCGSDSDLETGRIRFSLPLPLAEVLGSMCSACRGARGDMRDIVTRRLWAASDLPQKWGWTPPPSRQAQIAITLGAAVDTDGAPVEEYRWDVASPWHAYTWAHHLFTWRREHIGDDGAREPTPPRRPFGWLK